MLSKIRIRTDEAWFVLVLLALTSFHGLSMLPLWEPAMSRVALWIGDSGQLLASFSIALFVAIIAPVIIYAGAIFLVAKLNRHTASFGRLFAGYVMPLLPLAFAYHIAHNLSHLFREGQGLAQVISNPLGVGTLPMNMAEKHARHIIGFAPDTLVFAMQVSLMVLAFWLALKLILERTRYFSESESIQGEWRHWPVTAVVCLFHGFNLWLLTQPMVMRT
jgi:heme/copper-type cytochrome/quinol oxidase subunit 4